MPRWSSPSHTPRHGTSGAAPCSSKSSARTATAAGGRRSARPRLTAAIVQHYRPLLIGADALATEAIWQTLYNMLRDHGQKGLPIEALSAVDIALWDLKGRHLGLPIHRLLGGPLRTSVQAYATGFYRKCDGEPLEYLVEEARQRRGRRLHRRSS